MERYQEQKGDESLCLSLFTQPKNKISLQIDQTFKPDMLAMSRDYKYLATACWEQNKILLWNLENKAIKMDIALSEIEKEVCFMYFQNDSTKFYYAQARAKKMIIVYLQTKRFHTTYIDFGEELSYISIFPNEGYFWNIFYGVETRYTLWFKSSIFIVKKLTILQPMSKAVISQDETKIITATPCKFNNSFLNNYVFTTYNLHNQKRSKSFTCSQIGQLQHLVLKNGNLIAFQYYSVAWTVSIINLKAKQIIRTLRIEQDYFYKGIIDNSIIFEYRTFQIEPITDWLKIKILDLFTFKNQVVSSLISLEEKFFIVNDVVAVFPRLNEKQNENHIRLIFRS